MASVRVTLSFSSGSRTATGTATTSYQISSVTSATIVSMTRDDSFVISSYGGSGTTVNVTAKRTDNLTSSSSIVVEVSYVVYVPPTPTHNVVTSGDGATLTTTEDTESYYVNRYSSYGDFAIYDNNVRVSLSSVSWYQDGRTVYRGTTGTASYTFSGIYTDSDGGTHSVSFSGEVNWNVGSKNHQELYTITDPYLSALVIRKYLTDNNNKSEFFTNSMLLSGNIEILPTQTVVNLYVGNSVVYSVSCYSSIRNTTYYASVKIIANSATVSVDVSQIDESYEYGTIEQDITENAVITIPPSARNYNEVTAEVSWDTGHGGEVTVNLGNYTQGMVFEYEDMLDTVGNGSVTCTQSGSYVICRVSSAREQIGVVKFTIASYKNEASSGEDSYTLYLYDYTETERVNELVQHGRYKIKVDIAGQEPSFSDEFNLYVEPRIKTTSDTPFIAQGQTLEALKMQVVIDYDITAEDREEIWSVDGAVVEDYTFDEEATHTIVVIAKDVYSVSGTTVKYSGTKTFQLTVSEASYVIETPSGFPMLSTMLHTKHGNNNSYVFAGADCSAVGNTIKIDYKMPYSTIAGYKNSPFVSGSIFKTAYIQPVGVPYGDQYGRFDKFEFKFGVYREVNNYGELGTTARLLPELPDSGMHDFTSYLFESPLIIYHKDSGNTHALTYQMNFIPSETEGNRFILGYRFIEKLLTLDNTGNTRKIYVSNETYSKFENRIGKGTIVNGTISTLIDANNNNITLTLSGVNLSGYKSWAITDNDNNLLIAVNIVDPFDETIVMPTPNKVYFNFKHNR